MPDIMQRKVNRSSRRRREARQRGCPYRSSVTGKPHHVKMYYIKQFLPHSSREAVYPMRALLLACVEIQRIVRGTLLRWRFDMIDWGSLNGRERRDAVRSLHIRQSSAVSVLASSATPMVCSDIMNSVVEEMRPCVCFRYVFDTPSSSLLNLTHCS